MRLILTTLLVAIVAGGAMDLALDRPETPWSFHVLFEVALLACSAGGVVFLWTSWWRARRLLARSHRESAALAGERDAWRVRAERLLRGLGEAIDVQLHDWGLTEAERETALLLLKGFGHKEIAALQSKSERTVRQHAIAVYRKSGLAGRAELSAFFLEDLLLPVREGDRVAGRRQAP